MSLLSRAEVARELRVSEKTVYRMVHMRRFPAYKIGGQLRFEPAWVAELKAKSLVGRRSRHG